MRVLTKGNIDCLEKFLKKATKDLTTTDYTCSRFILDDDLAVFVGWLPGYDKEEDNNIKDDGWGLNAGIKIRNDVYWADYEGLLMPIFNDDSGEVCMTDCTITKDENYRGLARYFLKEYKAIREGINKNKISIDF